MFSSQESINIEPIDSEQCMSSPVRKKGRAGSRTMDDENFNRIYNDLLASAQLFNNSQESVIYSQFSQDFAERLGQMSVTAYSQENSNISAESHVPLFNAVNQMSSANVRSPTAIDGFISKPAEQTLSTSIESEKEITVAPPMKNVFLGGANKHVEDFFRKNSEQPSKSRKIWISAFKERPRYCCEFEEIRELGEGTFSKVFCARHRLDGTLYAVKRVKERIITEKQGQRLAREVNALSLMNGCPNFIRYFNSWVEHNHLYIQTELCHLGNLEEFLKVNPNSFSILNPKHYQKPTQNNPMTQFGSNSYMDRDRSESFNACFDHSFTGSSQASKAHFNPKPKNIWTGDSSHSAPSVGNNAVEYVDNEGESREELVSVLNGLNVHDIYKPRGISEKLARLLLLKMAETLEFIHNKEMVHLDIRPANVFLTTSESYNNQPFHPLDPQKILSILNNTRDKTALKSSLFANIMKNAQLNSHVGKSKKHSEDTYVLDESPNELEEKGENRQYSEESKGKSDLIGLIEEGQYTLQDQVEMLLLGGFYTIRLGDCGHFCRVDSSAADVVEGETRYCARELILCDESRKWDLTKADMFSLGASIYEMCLGRLLGTDDSNSKTEECASEWHDIREGKLSSTFLQKYSPELTEIILKLLDPTPKLRPSASDLISFLTTGNALQTCLSDTNLSEKNDLLQLHIAEKDKLIAQLLEENQMLKEKTTVFHT